MMRVLFCGQSSYPSSKSATANRYRAIADIVHEGGGEPIFINRHPVFNAQDDLTGLKYRCLWPSGIYRSKSFIIRNLKKLIALPCELLAILRVNRERKISVINVYTQFFFDLLFYRLAASIVGAKCAVHLVELRSSISNRSRLLRLNDWFFERYCGVLCEVYVAISRKTEEIFLSRCRTGIGCVVPPVFDFSSLSGQKGQSIHSGRFLLYCASLEYEEVAWFVIEAFLKGSSGYPDVNLVMVLSGKISSRIRSVISNPTNRVFIYSGVPYVDLLGLYQNADALLIPLRDCPQDVARFPQKISEYLAAGRPILTTAVGEISFYFKNGVDAIVANSYDVSVYANCINSVISGRFDLDEIGRRGRALGEEKFDVRAYVDRLCSLFST